LSDLWQDQPSGFRLFSSNGLCLSDILQVN
jgi:hypothetical protein